MVFLYLGDQLFDFFGLPRSHCVGGLKQVRWQRPEVGGNVLMVLSGVGDVVMVKVAVAIRKNVHLDQSEAMPRNVT